MGVIAESSGVIVTVVSEAAGVQMENSFQLYNTNPTGQILPVDAADYFEDTVIPLWQSVVSNVCHFQLVKVETTAGPGFIGYPPYFRSLIGINGTVTGDLAPPFVSARIVKIPDIDNQDTPNAPSPWRNGYTRIGGLSETMMAAGGYLASSFGTAMENLADSLLEFTAAGETMHLYLRRFTTGDAVPDYFVPVLDVFPDNLLTTQNTRKLNR